MENVIIVKRVMINKWQ